MKLLQTFVACAAIPVSSLVNASPLPIEDTPLPTDGSATQPAHVFGRSVCKPLSKPKGRLFNIGGATQYFAGKCPSNIRSQVTHNRRDRNKCMVARTPTPELRCRFGSLANSGGKYKKKFCSPT